MVSFSPASYVTLLTLGLILSCHMAVGHVDSPKEQKFVTSFMDLLADAKPRLLDMDSDEICEPQAFLTLSGAKTSYKAGALAFLPITPDRAIVALQGGGYEVFNTTTGEKISHVPGFGRSLTWSIAVDSNEEYVAVGIVSDVLIWNLATGTLHATLEAHQDRVLGIHFTADGNIMVTSGIDTKIKVWSYSDGNATLTRTITTDDDTLRASALSPDDQYVASANYSYVYIWDIATGEKFQETSLESTPRALVWSVDSDYVITNQNSSLYVIDASDGSVLRFFDSRDTYSLVILPDGVSVAQGDSWGATIYDWTTGSETLSLRDADYAYGIAVNPDGDEILVGHSEGPLVYDITTETLISTLYTFWVDISSVTFSHNGEVLIVAPGNGDYITAYESETLDELWQIDSGSYIRAMSFSLDNQYIAYPDSDTVIVVDASNGEEFAESPSQETEIYDVKFSPDGTQVLTGNRNGEINIWTISTDDVVTIVESDASLNSVAWSPDGTMFASGGSESVTIWSTETSERLFTFTDHTDRIESVAFSPDGSKLVSGGNDAQGFIWSTSTGDRLLFLDGYYQLYTVAFSPNGNHVIGAGGDSIFVWEAEFGTKVYELLDPIEQIGQMAVSSDGRYVAAGGYDHLVVFQSCWGCGESTTGMCHSQCSLEGTYWDPVTHSCAEECPHGLYNDPQYNSCVYSCTEYDGQTCITSSTEEEEEEEEYDENVGKEEKDDKNKEEDEDGEDAEDDEVENENEASEDEEEEETAGDSDDDNTDDEGESSMTVSVSFTLVVMMTSLFGAQFFF